jgi:hypothetical protein
LPSVAHVHLLTHRLIGATERTNQACENSG